MLPHTVALDLIAGLGFEGHDLTLVAGDRGVVSLDEVRKDIPGWAGRLEERIRGRGLEIADVAAWSDYKTMAPNHPDPVERENGLALFRDVLALATALGAPGLTMVPGIDWPDESHEESLARAGQELERRALEAAEHGLRFSVEPHVGSVCRTPADAMRLCELAPTLTYTLDYSHYVCQGFSDEDIEPLLAHAGHLHARGAADGRMQAPLAENTIDYERFVDQLGKRDYDGFLSVEYVWISWGGLNDVDVISETVMLRDLLRARLAGESWRYPEFDWPIDSVTS
jgi:sugar phosphate isomerase/epimerase